MKSNIALSLIFFLVSQLLSPKVQAESLDDPDTARVLKSKFALGVAASINRFDTSYKLTDTSTRRSIFIDGEGSLNLPETDISPTIYGNWQISRKHGVGFRFFGTDREGTSLPINGDIGDANITGNLTTYDRSNFYLLNYSYTFSTKPDALVRGVVGLYGLDLKLGYDAQGQITEDGKPPITGRLTDEIGKFIPLPLIGIDFWQAVSRKWALGARFSMIGGNFDDTQGLVFDANIKARYQLSNHVALLMGANYFSGDIDINSNSKKTKIKYGYEGFNIGLDFNW